MATLSLVRMQLPEKYKEIYPYIFHPYQRKRVNKIFQAIGGSLSDPLSKLLTGTKVIYYSEKD
jgi:hypothetical protein